MDLPAARTQVFKSLVPSLTGYKAGAGLPAELINIDTSQLNHSTITPANINEALLLAYASQFKANTKAPKRFPCSICGKTFSKGYNRSVHMRLHTNEKPFVCQHEGCGKAFTWKSSLKSHIASHQQPKEPHLLLPQRDNKASPPAPETLPEPEPKADDTKSEAATSSSDPPSETPPSQTLETRPVDIFLDVGAGDGVELGDLDMAPFGLALGSPEAQWRVCEGAVPSSAGLSWGLGSPLAPFSPLAFGTPAT